MTHRSLFSFAAGLLAAGLVALAVATAGAQECFDATATLTADVETEGPYAGLWKYTIQAEWDLGPQAPAVSHIGFLLGLEDCPEICDTEVFFFDDPAGTSTGIDSTGAPCVATYEGIFECRGDPNVGMPVPTIKFDQPAGQPCEADRTGTGTWCFYSPFAPAEPDVHPGAAAIKHGTNVCFLTLTGSLPQCEPPLGVEGATWAGVKTLFR